MVFEDITKDLDGSNDTIPPTLNAKIAADTITEISEKTKTNPNASFKFIKQYQINLQKKTKKRLDSLVSLHIVL